MKTLNQDILEINKGIICHQVNLQGRMGRGLALQIAKKYPKAKEEYLSFLPNRKLGDITLSEVAEDLYICHLHSQDRYGSNKQYTDYSALENSLRRCYHWATGLDLPLYIPYKIGCGLGGGDWEKVEKIIRYTAPNSVVVKLSYN